MKEIKEVVNYLRKHFPADYVLTNGKNCRLMRNDYIFDFYLEDNCVVVRVDNMILDEVCFASLTFLANFLRGFN